MVQSSGRGRDTLGGYGLTTAKKNFVGGKGDRGSLQGAFQVSVGGLLFIILVFLISPALSNYGLMNLFLFAELFAFGYYSASLGGQSLHLNVAMFFVVATVSLNAENRLRLKLYLARTLAWCCRYSSLRSLVACSGRYFRSAELRKRLIEFFSICSNLMAKPPGHGDEALSKSSDFDPDRSSALGERTPGAQLSGAEVEKLLTLTVIMRRLALHLSNRARREAPALPENITRLVEPCVQKTREEFRETTEALANVFREGSTRVAVPSTEDGTREFPRHIARGP